MANRSEKRVWRKEMLSLINMDNKWYEDTESVRYKRILELGKKLGGKIQQCSQINSITEEEFHKNKAEGRTYKEIAEYFGVDQKTLQIWREQHGYIVKKGKSKSNND
ncbi:hypothetical protein BCR24_14995 [Enterococcus ureilyticus]|uniref:Uncharacterized protein n=1 Tax=Enterococcus ureilyticus TaxID=1131292 RepID=A0A1E5HC60_9ENTE|nr:MULTISPECIES: hypothetical protein [Enterococcus]MBM7690420.1 DNA-directed RNA polymerase specialized sigma24 family protein [Enterococcus ureilyticus]MBO0473612.1 hypothetical protein [Enterococcus ureasiticus]OEG22514.1 hypothetical protein BCR24_14995 [Enterococcus ureilyticus]